MRFFVVTCTLLQGIAATARVAVSPGRAPLPTSISYWNRNADVEGPLAEHRRAAATTTSDLITCGYEDGNVNSPRSAGPGFDCRVDTAHGIWGFCPTTVIAATDCGLAAACIDSGSCSGVCHINTDTALTTFTCPSSGGTTFFCSTAMLTFGVDQTYGYIACAGDATTDHYVVTPTFTPSSSTTSSSKSAATTSTSSTSVKSSTTASTSTRLSTSTPTSSTSAIAVDSANKTGSSATESKTTSTTSNLGAIIGGALGGIALICLSAVAVVFIIKRRGSQSSNTSAPPAHDTMAAPPYTYFQPHSGSQMYEADSTSSGQKLFWKDPNPGYAPRSPVELPSHMN